MIFYGLDRWFIKIFFTEYDFAYYSFAISMLNLINILINSISVIFYNYIAKDENKTIINNLKRYLLILGAFASLSYFGFAAVINIFIKIYTFFEYNSNIFFCISLHHSNKYSNC